MGKSQQHGNNPQNDVFTWLANTTSEKRFDFMKKALDSFPLDEIKGVQRLTENARKRKKTSLNNKSNNKRVCRRDVPVCSESPVSFQVKPWWAAYKDSDIVALDAEMVSLYEKIGQKHIVEAASIAIVRLIDKEVLYYETIYHKKGSFMVNSATLKVNGFRSDSLENGKNFDQVRMEVDQILKGKLVITIGGAGDFKSLKLPISNYDVFDLHQHWKKWNRTYSKAGVPNFEPISLKSLYWHYKGKPVQQGVHNPITDCLCTIELFGEYKKIKKNNIESRESEHGIDDFQNILRIK